MFHEFESLQWECESARILSREALFVDFFVPWLEQDCYDFRRLILPFLVSMEDDDFFSLPMGRHS